MGPYIQAARLIPGAPGRTKHSIGLPVELGGDPVRMADPAFVAVASRPDGFFLERYTDTAEFAGDTWHQTQADAVGQAEWEYAGRVDVWVHLADETNDLDDVVEQLSPVTLSDAD